MGQAAQEREGLRLKFGAIATNYREAMDGLARIAHQHEVAFRKFGGSNEILIDLFKLHNKLSRVNPRESLEKRLVELTDEDVAFFSRHGSFRLLGPSSVLETIAEFKAGDIPKSSSFYDLYRRYRDPYDKLTIWDLCPEGDEARPGMRLIVVKREEEQYYERERFPWRIGWATEEEFRSLALETLFEE